jgi:dienelactone hydrolase
LHRPEQFRRHFGSRYRDWGERLAKNGYVVLMPDSNGSRGAGSQCATRSRSIRQ